MSFLIARAFVQVSSLSRVAQSISHDRPLLACAGTWSVGGGRAGFHPAIGLPTVTLSGHNVGAPDNLSFIICFGGYPI